MDLNKYLTLAKDLNCRVVIETKTKDGLTESVAWLHNYVEGKMNISIRIAEAVDAHNFAYVLCESWKIAYKNIITPEEMIKNTDIDKRAAFFEMLIPSGKGQFFIAYDDNKPCGICSTCKSRDANMPDWGEVVAIYTLSEYWGKVVGKALIDAAVLGLKQQGFKHVMLWTFDVNKRARYFYEKYGFAYDGTSKESGLNQKEVRYIKEIK